MRSFLVCIATVLSLFAAVSGECGTVCPYNYEPICGQLQNGTHQTFSNACVMQVDACKLRQGIIKSYPGECKQDTRMDTDECVRICPMFPTPLCAQLDDGTAETYSSKCEMEVALCQSKKRVINSYPGECTKEMEMEACVRICPRFPTPLCAQFDDGTAKTFDNKCEMEVASCQSKKRVVNSYPGECTKEMEMEACVRICPRFPTPLCALLDDGTAETFDNKCEMEVALCQSKKRMNNSYPGECTKEMEMEACVRICPMFPTPLCAQLDDGTTVTFGNTCEMEVSLCQSKKRALSWTEGECN